MGLLGDNLTVGRGDSTMTMTIDNQQGDRCLNIVGHRALDT